MRLKPYSESNVTIGSRVSKSRLVDITSSNVCEHIKDCFKWIATKYRVLPNSFFTKCIRRTMLTKWGFFQKHMNSSMLKMWLIYSSSAFAQFKVNVLGLKEIQTTPTCFLQAHKKPHFVNIVCCKFIWQAFQQNQFFLMHVKHSVCGTSFPNALENVGEVM